MQWCLLIQYYLSLQLQAQTNVVSMEDSSASMQVDQNETLVHARDGMQNGGTELVIYNSKVVQ